MDAHAIVVGAGPAGAAAAYRLAAAGLPLIWLDRPMQARAKPCAGGLTPKALRLLPADPGSVVRERTSEVLMSWRGHRLSSFAAPGELCLLTHRPEFDHWHRQQAQRAGAALIHCDRLVAVRQQGDGVALTVSRGGRQQTYRAHWLIAADGAHSPVRRLVCGQPAVPPAIAIEGQVARQHCQRWPAMQFDFGAVAGGYGWLFPKQDHINVGLYSSRQGAGLGQAALAAYVQQQLGTNRLTEVQGFPIATQGDRLRLTAGRVLFTGDAAGLAEPLLGEGIYGALLSGGQAALAVMGSGDAAQVYEQLMMSWRHELTRTRQLARLFYGTLPLAFGALVHGLRQPVTTGMADGLTLLQSWRRWLTPRSGQSTSSDTVKMR